MSMGFYPTQGMGKSIDQLVKRATHLRYFVRANNPCPWRKVKIGAHAGHQAGQGHDRVANAAIQGKAANQQQNRQEDNAQNGGEQRGSSFGISGVDILR